MKRILTVLLLLVLAVVLVRVVVYSIADEDLDEDIPEYKMKAVLFEKFADFIDWPNDLNVNNSSKFFVITVIGENPFFVIKKDKKTSENWLNLLYNEKKIRGKEVKIQFILDVKDIPGSHLLFISNSEKKNLSEIIATANKNYTLTVSDTPGFAKKGAHINFYVDKGNLKFEVNETAIRKSGFRVSYHMLKLARIIDPWRERK